MSDIRKELIYAIIDRARALINYNIHDDFHKRFEFVKQTVLADKSLTKDEKIYAIRLLNKDYDRDKILFNDGIKRICENCNQECLATLYCEHCVRNYLKADFSNWTSENNDIDNLIQKCQLEALAPDMIVEWIPYNNLQNIEYLTKGGFSEIYKATWIDGRYEEWDSEKKQLKRISNQPVILKRLENVESANQSWFEEAKSHLTINNKWSSNIVPSYGLTRDPSSGNYTLVIYEMEVDLRTYLQKYHNQLTWKERIKITNEIIVALYRIHEENAIHRDLHSGNILYLSLNQRWYIGDLGFCGPADKSSKCIYGNLPYIAPEVISGKEYTFKSDIYSIAILMWEISSGQPPFINYKHDYYLAMNIINGIRPRIVSGTPSEFESLMKQCWDADPLKRPDIQALWEKIHEINLYYQSKSDESFQLATNNNLKLNKTSSTETISSRLFTSKVHQFENFPEPRNATADAQNDYSRTEMVQQQLIKNVVDNNDEDETYNNPNFHLEEQNEFEIPDDMDKL